MLRGEQLNFVAVDFETANQSRASVCQAGVAVVRNGVVEDVQDWLVQPPTGLDSFQHRNVQIHRITPSMAAGGMLWGESAERLASLVGDLPVIAHNAQFDRGVYLAACDSLGVAPSPWQWYCSLEISQQHLPLSGHSLDVVAAHLGIDIGRHHHAGHDARAAAEVLLAISRTSQTRTLDGLGPALLPPGRRRRATSSPGAVTYIPAHTLSKYGKVSDLPKPNPGADPGHPLHGEYVVLSGEVGAHDRDHWIDLLADLGAQPQLNITNKTTLVVIGANAGRTKTANAEKRRVGGQPIRTIPGESFMALLEEKPRLEHSEIEDNAAAAHPMDTPATTESAPPLVVELAEPEPAPVSDTPVEESSPAPAEREEDVVLAPVAPEATPVAEPQQAAWDTGTFQHWGGPAGSLPEGWTLSMQQKGRPRRITTTALNRNPTGTGKRIGITIGIILGSFIIAVILTPLLGPVAPLLFLVGLIYGIVFPIKSARADQLRWQYWAGRPEPRAVILAHSKNGAAPATQNRS